MRSRPQVIGIAIAIAAVVFVDLLTNTVFPAAQHDSIYYLDVAANGLIGNPNLVAPFAYRPLVPMLVGAIVSVTGADLEVVFLWTTRLSVVLLLYSVWALAFSVSRRALPAATVTIIAAMSFHVAKVPLFWYTLIDVEACLVMVWALHALLRGRPVLCLLLSCVGMLMKEFLIIPALMALIVMATNRAPRRLSPLLLSSALLIATIALPRLLLPIAESFQAVDPMHSADWLANLQASFAPSRMSRVGFSLLSFLAPALMLISKQRLANLCMVPRSHIMLAVGYLLAVATLSLLGGSGIPRFALYLLPLLAIATALLLRSEHATRTRVAVAELIVVAAATFWFNRMWVTLPHPTYSLIQYVEIFGGHAAGSDARLSERFFELLATITLGAGLTHLVRNRLGAVAVPSPEGVGA